MEFSIVSSTGERMNEWGGLTPAEKTRENRLRRQATRLGLEIRKSRARAIHIDDLGGYSIVSLHGKRLVHGERLSLDLDDVEAYLAKAEDQLRKGRGL